MAISDSIGLLFKIKADSSQASSELDKFNKDVKKSTGDIKDATTSQFNQISKSLGLTAQQTAALTTALPLLGAALAGVTAAAVGAGVALFSIAKEASDYGSAIKDMSDKTGLSAESLSTLKLAADQSGSSLEAISEGVTKFSKLIGSAAEGSETAKESLKRLGLDPQTALNDLDGSLEIVFKRIFEAQNPIVRTKLATEAFSKAGANLIPVIKQMGGDFQAFKKYAEEVGAVLSDKDVEAADDFGDALTALNAQAKTLLFTFAKEFLPIFTQGMKDLSKFASDNKEAFTRWGSEVASIFTKLKEMAAWTTSADGATFLALIRSAFSIATGGTGVVVPNYVPPSDNVNADANASIKRPGGLGDEDGAIKSAYEKRIADAQRLTKEEQSNLENQLANLKREHTNQLTELDGFVAERKRLTNAQLKSELDSIQAEKAAVLERQKTDEKFADEAVKRLADLGAREAEAKRKNEQELNRISDEALKDRLKKLQDDFNAREAVQSRLDSDAIANIRDNAEQKKVGFQEAETAIYDIQLKGFERRRDILREEAKAAADNTAELARIQQEFVKLKSDSDSARDEATRRKREGESKDIDFALTNSRNRNQLQANDDKAALARLKFTNEEKARLNKLNYEELKALAIKNINDQVAIDLKEFNRKIALLETERQLRPAEASRINQELKVLAQEQTAYIEEAERKKQKAIQDTIDKEIEKNQVLERGRYASGTRPRTVAGEPVNDITKEGGFLSGIIDGLGGLDSLTKPMDIMNSLGQTLTQTFGQVAQAVGNAVHSFVLFGTAGGSFRKFAAEVIASVAQMAVVQAVFELAQGLAMSALFWFTGNPTYAKSAGEHYLAAAVFGGIGGVAAVVGRGVAGDAFKQQTSSGAVSGSGSSSSGSSGSTDPRVIEENRVRRNEPTSRQIIEMRLPKGMVEKEVVDGINNRTELHGAIVKLAIESA